MFKDRIELEIDKSYYRRQDRAQRNLQRNYEFFWDVNEVFPNRITKDLTEFTLNLLDTYDVGRRRFWRIAGPIRVPLTSVRQPTVK